MSDMPFPKECNIVLVGFMGTGKTVVGQRLAKMLGREFQDLDTLIEEETQMSIAQIFSRHGESYFRKLEAEMVARVSREKGFIISTGGGVMLREENVRNLKSNGILIALTASPEVILQRLAGKEDRPLLQGDDRQQKVEELLRRREPYYQKADYLIDTTGRTVEEVVREIFSFLKERGIS